MKYHDEEWGPVHDDRLLFEKFVLEGARAGLSLITILKRRENYCCAFDRFDVETVAAYDGKRVERLMQDAGIIRNRLKIKSAIHNARRVLEIQQHGSLDAFLLSFVGGNTIQNRWKTFSEVPVTTSESDAMSKALKKAGFKFIGSTSCYALMQAVGLVNDHAAGCFRQRELGGACGTCLNSPLIKTHDTELIFQGATFVFLTSACCRRCLSSGLR